MMGRVSAASSEPSDCRISEPIDKRRFQCQCQVVRE